MLVMLDVVQAPGSMYGLPAQAEHQTIRPYMVVLDSSVAAHD